jgi:hypothetical protein
MTVYKAVSYSIAAGGYFIPDSKFAKGLGVCRRSYRYIYLLRVEYRHRLTSRGHRSGP